MLLTTVLVVVRVVIIGMEDGKTKAEAIRLMSGKTRRANTRARWENVYRMYERGKSFEQIGKWIGKSPSTARQLLKRAAMERSKAPGFQWPVDKDGKKICDIPHPMPLGEKADNWAHSRGYPLYPRSVTGPPLTRAHCPVCRRTYAIARTLCEVFAASGTKSSSLGCASVTTTESMAGCDL
jgi:hypothetical protein